MKDKLEYSSSLEPMHLISDTRSAIILARGTSKENAKKLIHRYNSHDALVEALEAAGRYHQGFNEEIGLKIRAVLASIKEAK